MKDDDIQHCQYTCQLHKGHEDRIKDIESILHGKDGNEGWLVKMGRFVESFSIVRILTYSFAGTILLAFVGALVAIVIRSPR